MRRANWQACGGSNFMKPSLNAAPMSHGLTLKQADALLGALEATALVSMTNKEGDIVYVNQKFIDVSGYSRQELLGQNHRILKSGLQSKDFFTELWKTISSGNVWRGEIKNQAKDGSTYWVDTSIAPILDKDGIPYQYISVRFLITIQMLLKEKTEHQSHTDPMTGLANRRLLTIRLKKALHGQRSSDLTLAVLTVDLDYFKAVNDRYGHATGDLLLKKVAERLLSVVRTSDTVARIGGDEFVIMAENIVQDDAEALAKKIIQKITKLYKINFQELKIGVSVGVALSQVHDSSVNSLLKRSDQALYRAKIKRGVYAFAEGPDA
jgi:diguanylate cyclase (GGDEF)-like protein/PAS domain S-box-containing protein